jgi:hypothetical protein
MAIVIGIVVFVVVIVAVALVMGAGGAFRAEGRRVDVWEDSWGTRKDVHQEFERPRDEGRLL